MPKIDPDIACHHFSIKHAFKLVTQKKRKEGEDNRVVIFEEVNKLKYIGFPRETGYPT